MMPNVSVASHRIRVASMNLFLGAQNWVDCLRRHPPTIHTPRIAVIVPAMA